MSQTPETETGASGPPVVVELLPEITFSERDIAGRKSYVCHDAQQGRFFHFGPAEYQAAQLLDGSHGLPKVLQMLRQSGVDWSPVDLGQFVSALVKHKLARPWTGGNSSSSQPSSAESTTSPSRRPAVPVRMMAGLLSQRLPLFQADHLAARLASRFGFLFRPAGVCLWLAVVLSGGALVVANHLAFARQLRHFLSPQTWPWMILSLCLIKVAHEAGHAMAARRQGVRVGQAGIPLFMLAPLAFVNVTDAWRLPRRWARIQIALAGVYLELLIAGLAVWCWHLASAETIRHLAAQVALLAGPASLLINANPLLRLDGYYVLSDAWQIPNLRMHGRKQILSRIEHLLLGRRLRPSLLDGWRVRAASVHAVCSLVFQFVWLSGLVIAVSAWARGLGLLIAVVATFFWLLFPLGRWLISLWYADDWHQVRIRLACIGCFFLLAGCMLCFVPSPWGRRVPVVIRYQDEQIARAATDGFVRAVHVSSGDTVAPGDLLVEMEAPDLSLQRDSMAVDCQASRMRSRQLSRQGNLAMAAAELERLVSLRRQLVELERQVDALQVRATRSGIVSSSHTSELVGQYIHRGEILFRIGDESKKEVLASIGGSDLDCYLAAARGKVIRPVRLRGGTRLNVPVHVPQPRISLDIPHPALASTTGGPLPTEISETTDDPSANKTRLVAPRSRSISPLDQRSSKQVRVGQQGMLMIGDTRSVWDRLADRIDELLDKDR